MLLGFFFHLLEIFVPFLMQPGLKLAASGLQDCGTDHRAAAVTQLLKNVPPWKTGRTLNVPPSPQFIISSKSVPEPGEMSELKGLGFK